MIARLIKDDGMQGGSIVTVHSNDDDDGHERYDDVCEQKDDAGMEIECCERNSADDTMMK